MAKRKSNQKSKKKRTTAKKKTTKQASAKSSKKKTGSKPSSTKKKPASKPRGKESSGKAEGKLRVVDGPVFPSSSWVVAYGYVLVGTARGGTRRGIMVEYIDGYVAFYPNQDFQTYSTFKRSRSKGKGVWRYLYYEPYEDANSLA